jgi:hypothetical protein
VVKFLHSKNEALGLNPSTTPNKQKTHNRIYLITGSAPKRMTKTGISAGIKTLGRKDVLI